MADIVLHGVTPQPGNVVSVPVAIQYGLAQGGLVVGEPTDVTCPAWNEAGDQGPIAEGSRAHIFIAPSWHYEQTGLGPMISEDDWKLDILSTIQSIKCNNIPLSNFAAKLGNAYCYDYTNPYTRGCAVSLTDKDYSGMKTRFSFTRVGMSSGRIDASGYNTSNTGTWYYKSASAHASSGWTQDGVNKDNMYEGFSKDVSTGNVYRYDINNTKSALDPADVETHNVECYRGLFFADDPYNTGEIAAGDILVVVDFGAEMEYTVYDGDDEHGNPQTRTTLGPLAYFAIGWKTPYGDAGTRLSVTSDPDYEYSRMIDVYPPAAAEEFNFIALGGGGGGGNKGHGGRGVSSSIPMRITSRGDVDYRHFLDLYDETNYNERNMFLTNFVGRIPYRYIDYDSSEGGGTGIVRVETNLQFTHFIGTSFSDDNVPRVYEVVSHKDLGGNPKTLLCTFRVCHLKDYFQHFGVTAENEFLVERSTNSGLYNPWLEDSRIFSEDYNETRFGFGSMSFDPRVMMVLNDNRVFVMPLGNITGDYSPAFVPSLQQRFDCVSFRGILQCVADVDTDPRSSSTQVSFINGVLSRIRAVYLVPEQVNQSAAYGTFEIPVTIPVYTNPSDPGSLTSATYTLALTNARQIVNPEECIWFGKIYTKDSGGNLFDDWTDINANWYMNIPWYGGIGLAGTQVKRMIDYGNGTIDVRYYLSPLDGTITIAGIYTDGVAADLMPWKPLPTIPIPSSARTLTYRQIRADEARAVYLRNEQTSFNAMATGAGAAVATVGALATGNLLGAGAAAIGGVAGVIGINVSNDIKNRSAMVGSNHAAQNITIEKLNCSGYELTAIMRAELVRVKKVEIINVYSAIGYPCRALWRSVGAVNGKKYWVSILGNIKGTSAYAQAVRGEIERDGIIYNYS